MHFHGTLVSGSLSTIHDHPIMPLVASSMLDGGVGRGDQSRDVGVFAVRLSFLRTWTSSDVYHRYWRMVTKEERRRVRSRFWVATVVAVVLLASIGRIR